ncbi:lipase 2 [Exophiala xenobiotica]|nr:lipase 2 [Exophiala xenobiotica]KAK5302044.1 lipase 2 [Exophiala xenobiotica]KAK5487577.1 lipase 2 [Exophiala xenobiotica]
MPWRICSLRVVSRRLRSPPCHSYFSRGCQQLRHDSSTSKPPPASRQAGSHAHEDNASSSSTEEKPIDPRLPDLGRLIENDYAAFQSHYSTPKHPIVLAHGLLGFDELHLLPGSLFPSIHYWRGIKDAFSRNNIECITTTVPRTGSIEQRAAALSEQIASRAKGRDINIVAHSMGGLDARYLISRIYSGAQKPSPPFRVRSLTTIATPHHGSSAADMLFRDIGPDLLPRIYAMLDRLSIDSGAFQQLTTSYVNEHFNPAVPDDPDVRYFSYGATATPHLFSVFRLSHDLMTITEGPNDGLVSVRSSHWGEYKGTLVGVTHLDLINWTNRIKRVAARLGFVQERFNAVAFYLGVADMLAKEGF